MTLAGLVFGTILAPALRALIDRGPDGGTRVTAFHLGLTLFDPSTWTLLGRSVALAGTTTLGAWLVGVGVARLARHARRGLDRLAAVALAGLAVPPVCAAAGLRAWLGRLGRAPASQGSLDVDLAWLAAELSWAAPMVALAAARALRGLHPAWEEAARQAGGGRRAWRTVLRPVVRPGVARSLSAVFALALVEPSAPLLLGLRRTLAFGLIEATLRPGWHERAASLAVLALATAGAVGLAFRAWAGPRLPLDPREDDRARDARPAPWARNLAAASALAGLAVVALTPASGLALSVAAPGGPGITVVGSVGLASILSDPAVRAALGPSALLGAAVATLGMVLGWLATRPAESPGAASRGGRVVRAWVVPPLALAVGVATWPDLFRLAADAIGGAGGLRWLADRLEPSDSPGPLLAWAVVVSHLPALVVACGALEARARPVLVDAARVFGRRRRTAAAEAAWSALGPSFLAAWLRTALLAAIDVSSALVLTPTTQSRTLGPAALDVLAAPDDPRLAATFGLFVVAANLIGVGLASAARLPTLAGEPAR
jgi:ABC-type Fe3+ transport system permease subunit